MLAVCWVRDASPHVVPEPVGGPAAERMVLGEVYPYASQEVQLLEALMVGGAVGDVRLCSRQVH